MRTSDLKDLTGKMVKEWYKRLIETQMGCCSLHFASSDKYRYCVCMGWQSGYGPAEDERVHDGYGTYNAWVPPVTPGEKDGGWRICWKIGRQTHNNVMQCDYDIDFEMPFVTEAMAKADPSLEEGIVDDTEEELNLWWGNVITGKNNSFIVKSLGVPVGYKNWNDLAAKMRKAARRVWREWKNCDD